MDPVRLLEYDAVGENEWIAVAGNHHVGYVIRTRIAGQHGWSWRFYGLGATTDECRLWHVTESRAALDAWTDYFFPMIVAEATWPGSALLAP